MVLRAYPKYTKNGRMYITIDTPKYKSTGEKTKNVPVNCRFGIGQWLGTSHQYGPWIGNGDPEVDTLKNEEIRRIFIELEKIYLQLRKRFEREPSAGEIYRTYKGEFIDKPRRKLFDFINEYVGVMQLSGQGSDNYNNKLVPALQGYLKAKYNTNDYFVDAIDAGFLYRFELYLSKTNSARNTPFAPSTIKVYMEWMRAVVAYAQRTKDIREKVVDQHRIVTTVSKKDIMKSATDLDAWPMTPDELRKIESVAIQGAGIQGEGESHSNMNRAYDLRRARLLFILQTWTGLAFSDLENISDARGNIDLNLSGKKSFFYRRAKSKELAQIKLFPQAVEIIQALNYDLRPQESYSTFRRRMKALFRYYNIQLSKLQGSPTHIGRHIFGLRMLHMGFSMESVRLMMGHKTVKYTEEVYALVDMSKINADYDRIKKQEEGVPLDDKIAV